jgi:hypothetical protein
MCIMLRWLLTMFVVIAGANHFIARAVYVAMMPSALPAPVVLAYLWGGAEILAVSNRGRPQLPGSRSNRILVCSSLRAQCR